MALETYRPSGKSGGLAIPLCVFAGFVAALGGSFLYELTIHYIPLIYLNFLATLGFGALIGAAVGFGVSRGKCRTPAIAIGVVVIAAIAGDALSFARAQDRFLSEVLEELPQGINEENLGHILANPAMTDIDRRLYRAIAASDGTVSSLKEHFSLKDFIELRVQEGWSLGRAGRDGAPISGIFVYLIWLVELGTIVFLAFKMANSAVRRPFCEELDVWMEKVEIGTMPGVETAVIEAAVEAGDLPSLTHPASTPESLSTAKYTSHRCDGCDYAFLTIEVEWELVKKRGKPEKKSKTLLDRGRVTPADLDQLADHLPAPDQRTA